MANLIPFARTSASTGKSFHKVYVPLGVYNRINQQYFKISDQVKLDLRVRDFIESVGWIVEDLLASTAPKDFLPEFDVILEQPHGFLLSFTLPNRSCHRNIRRGLYQICRQLDDWNNGPQAYKIRSALYAKDDEIGRSTKVILAVGQLSYSYIEAMDFEEIRTNEKAVKQANIQVIR